MRTNPPVIISETNLSWAWAKAFLHVMAPGGDDSAPLVISLGGFENSVPVEDHRLRQAVDVTLQHHGGVSIEDNAFMIFPHRVWRRGAQDRHWLFARYERMLPKIKALNAKNCYGTYFGRMVGFAGAKGDVLHTVNQLDHILAVWERDQAKGHRPRLSALQVSCLDPAKDHTGQPVRGFPCLQQVSFAYDDAGGLAVSAYYPSQYVFDRGYGNYLGLCHLGQFMAHEMKLKLVRLNCYVNSPVHGDAAKKALGALKSAAEQAVAGGASVPTASGGLSEAGKV